MLQKWLWQGPVGTAELYFALGTRYALAQELYSDWVGAPHLGALQVSAPIVAWIHGCTGIYHWVSVETDVLAVPQAAG